MLEPYCSFNGESQGMQACIDEAGRGSWAGRVYTAAVIWNSDHDDDYVRLIKDSKKLSPAMRNMLAHYIMENAIDYSITFMEPADIDELNILNATFQSMHMALDSLTVGFDTVIVDGNRFPKYKDVPHKCIVGGDNKYVGIACASILAKVEHDQHMMEIATEYPQYEWDKNMGYGALAHLEALKTHGLCTHHRMSFNPMKTMLRGGSTP